MSDEERSEPRRARRRSRLGKGERPQAAKPGRACGAFWLFVIQLVPHAITTALRTKRAEAFFSVVVGSVPRE